MTVQGGSERPPAEAEVEGAAGRRGSVRGPSVVVGLALAVVAGLAAVVSGGPGRLTGDAASAAVAAGPMPAARGDAELYTLAKQVAARSNDVGSGRYALLRTETWADREPAPDEDGDVPAGVFVPYHEYRAEWFADDYSGRSVVDTTPRDGAAEHEEAVEPASEAAAGWDHRLRTLPTDDAAYAASIREHVDGLLPVWVGDDDVARYLATHEDPSAYLATVFVAWQFADSDDGGHQPRTPLERAVVLRYLATVPGAVVTNGVKDPAGREGIAVTVSAPADLFPQGEDRGNVTLLFDRRTGNLLASKHSVHPVTAPPTDLRYRRPGDRVVVVHTARFTDSIG
jgi:hypothetical protein